MEFLGDVVAWFTDAANWWGTRGLLARTREHVWLSAVAIAVSCVAALPIGLVLGHLRRGGALALNVSNVGRALPSFALLALAQQQFGLDAMTAYVALVALGIPPILTNTYVAISQIDADVVESARGMGLTGRQILRRIEVPLGLPLIMGGIRTSAVQIVATATLAALVGQGGLGRFIIDGRAVRDNVEVFAGALAVAVLAVLTEVGLGLAQKALAPKGLTAVDPDAPSVNVSLADAVVA